MSIDRNKVLEAAQKHLAKGNLDKAIAEFQKLMQADPKDVRTLLKVAELQARKGSVREAVDTYLKVGDTYASQGFFQKSVAVYKQAVKLDTSRLDALKKLAKNYEDLQHNADALAAYDMLAQANMAANNVEGALAAMHRATEIDPQNLAARIRYAEALSRANKTKEAAQEFERGATLIKQQGRMDDYIKVAERLLFHRENDLTLAAELAQLYLERSDGKRALTKLQILFKANPKDDAVLTMLAQSFVLLDQRDKAIQVLKELAKHHLEANRTEDRLRAMRRVLELDPTDVEAKHAVTGQGPAPKPKVDLDAVVPAAAVVGGGGRAGGFAGRAGPGAAPSVPQPGAAPAVPMPGAARPAAPMVPTPGAVPAGAFGAARPAAAPPPAVLASPDEDDVLIIDDDAPPAAPAPSPRPPAHASATVVQALPVAPPAAPAPKEGSNATRDATVKRLLDETEVFARYGLRPRIYEQFEKILGIAPDHVDVRRRLAAMYAEDGRSDDAVEQFLAIAQLIAPSDPGAAIATLREAQAIDEENPDVRNALRALDPNSAPSRRSSVPEDVVFLVDDEPDAAPPPSDEEPILFVDDEAEAAPAPAQPAAAAPARVHAEVPSPAAGQDAPRMSWAAVLSEEEDMPTRTIEVDVDSIPPPSPPVASTTLETETVSLPPIAIGTLEVEPISVAPPSPPVVAPHEPAPRAAPSAAYVPPAVSPVITTTPSVELPPVDAIVIPTIEIDVDSLAPPAAVGRHASIPDAPPAQAVPAAPAVQGPVNVPAVVAAPEPAPLAAEDRASLPRLTLTDFDLDAPISKDEFEAEQASAPAPEPVRAPSASSAMIEEILDEADFYLAQELWDEARETLQEALLASPNHPLLVEKLEEVDECERSGAAPPLQPSEDDAFAMAEKLASALGEDTGPGGAGPTEQVDVEHVFAQFKKGVEQQVDISDAETHYDLGIAYKEMGLLDDAVHEFEIAARSERKASVAFTMIGLCRSDQNRLPDAIAALEKGLAAPHRDLREELGLCFELGQVLARAGRVVDALVHLRRVQSGDPGFRGIAARIAELEAQLPRTEARDSGEDDLERAFDDLIGG